MKVLQNIADKILKTKDIEVSRETTRRARELIFDI